MWNILTVQVPFYFAIYPYFIFLNKLSRIFCIVPGIALPQAHHSTARSPRTTPRNKYIRAYQSEATQEWRQRACSSVLRVSNAQHSTAPSASTKPQRKYVCTQEGRVGKRQHMSSCPFLRIHISCWVLETNEEIEICSAWHGLRKSFECKIGIIGCWPKVYRVSPKI